MATLYHAALSSASYRVRIALALKGITLDTVEVDLGAREHHQASYQAINPQGLVPTLITDDGTRISQSLAIIDWIEQVRLAPPLLPADRDRRAAVLSFAHAIVSDIHPLQSRRLSGWLTEAGLGPAVTRSVAAQAISEGLSACEMLLRGQAGPYCYGNTVTLADICLVPQMRSARLWDVDLSRFSSLLRAEATCLRLDAFCAAA